MYAAAVRLPVSFIFVSFIFAFAAGVVPVAAVASVEIPASQSTPSVGDPASSARTLIYPRGSAFNDVRNSYPVKLLRLALSKGDNQFRLAPSKFDLQQNRSLVMVANGQGMDVVWYMTSGEREQSLLPIRVPIYKGLIGWRLLMIKAGDGDRFSRISSGQELQQLRAGQGHDWPDRHILALNGYHVEGVVNYTSLFRMLAAGRIDYFPRSVLEIWEEVHEHQNLGLVVEPSVALCYPAAYFFVNKQDSALAQSIGSGLKQAQADGSFDQLFVSYYGQFIKNAQLGQRHIIELDNPVIANADKATVSSCSSVEALARLAP